MAIITARERHVVQDWTASAALVPLDGEIRYLDGLDAFVINSPLSVLGNGVTAVAALPFREVIYVEMAANIDVSTLNIKGNIIRVQNTDTSNHTITTGGTPATYTIKPDTPLIFQFDGTNWLETPGISMFQAGTSINSTGTITNKASDYFERATSGANGILRTMPLAANNTDVKFILRKVDTGAGAAVYKFTEQLDGFTACPDGFYYLFLFKQHQQITVQSNGTTWNIVSGVIDMSTVGINTSDWTNRHLGDLVIVYDTQTVAHAIGEKITLASGNTGIIVWLDATTMIIKHATGTGIAVNNESITGSWGGASLVNGSTKNADTLIYHYMGLPMTAFQKEFMVYANTTYSELLAQRIGNTTLDGVPAPTENRGFALIGVDKNSFKFQSAANNMIGMNDDGTGYYLDNDDYSYQNTLIKNF